MKQIAILIILTTWTISSCNNSDVTKRNIQTNEKQQIKIDSLSGYAPVNGLNMYYEILGSGEPLVLIHGGGSTIQTSFGKVIHSFAVNRKVIAIELQGHGHTLDRPQPESFEQDADDIAALLTYLKVEKADFFGFSNGGNSTMQLAISHPDLVRKIVLGSTFYKREGFSPSFWESLRTGTLNDMPYQLREAYKRVAPDTSGLLAMFTKDKTRMLEFTNWKEEDIRSIKVPVLIIVGDHDVIRPEHAVEMFRLLPHARLFILPGTHGEYIGEVTTQMKNSKIPSFTVSVIEEFLKDPIPEI